MLVFESRWFLLRPWDGANAEGWLGGAQKGNIESKNESKCDFHKFYISPCEILAFKANLLHISEWEQ